MKQVDTCILVKTFILFILKVNKTKSNDYKSIAMVVSSHCLDCIGLLITEPNLSIKNIQHKLSFLTMQQVLDELWVILHMSIQRLDKKEKDNPLLSANIQRLKSQRRNSSTILLAIRFFSILGFFFIDIPCQIVIKSGIFAKINSIVLPVTNKFIISILTSLFS